MKKPTKVWAWPHNEVGWKLGFTSDTLVGPSTAVEFVSVEEADRKYNEFEKTAERVVSEIATERDVVEAKLAKAVEALEYIMDGYGLDAPDYRQTEYDEDGELVPDDWIVSHIRAALAEINKGETQ